jgi:hypothetical protein
MQGGRDYQATMESDYRIWSKALEGHKNATLAAFPSLDHLFRTGEGKAKPADYMQKEGGAGSHRHHREMDRGPLLRNSRSAARSPC